MIGIHSVGRIKVHNEGAGYFLIFKTWAQYKSIFLLYNTRGLLLIVLGDCPALRCSMFYWGDCARSEIVID